MIGNQLNNKRVGLYLRLSNEDYNKGESSSIINQREMLTKYCKEIGLTVIDEYVDDGYSGTNFDRPAFKRMLKDLEFKKIDTIITKDMSRLGREHIDTCYYIEKYFPENNIRYISLLDGMDSAIDNGLNDLTPFKAILNDMYAKDISKKVRSSKRVRAEAGLYMGTFTPYGYIKNPENKNHLIIDIRVSNIVKRIFDMGAEGISPMQISFKLMEDNIPSPSEILGNKHYRPNEFTRVGWHSEVVRRMLTNEVYIGNLVMGRTKKLNYKSKRILQVPENEWLITKNTHEAIIDEDVFKKARIHLDARKRTRRRVSTSELPEYNNILRGIIGCKECGKKFGMIPFKNKSGKKTIYFRCNTYGTNTRAKYCTPHTNNAEKLTKIIIEVVRNKCVNYIDESKLKKIAQTKLEKIEKETEKEKQIKSITKQVNIIVNKIDRMLDEKLELKISEEDFNRVYYKYDKQRKELEKELKEIEIKSSKENNKVDCKKIVKEFIKLKEITPTMLLMLVSKVEISQQREVYITYRFDELND